MDEMKDIRKLFKELDIGRQYLKDFRNKSVLTLEELKKLSRGEVNDIIGIDFDGSAEIISNWIEADNNKSEVDKEEEIQEKENLRAQELERKREMELLQKKQDKVELERAQKTITPKRIKELKRMLKNIVSSKVFKKQKKTISEKTYTDVTTGRNIVECLMRESNQTLVKAKEAARQMQEEGLILNLDQDKVFEGDSLEYYKIYANDRLDKIENKIAVESKNKEHETITNSKIVKLEQKMEDMNHEALKNIEQVNSIVAKANELSEIIVENFEGDDDNPEISKGSYSKSKYYKNLLESGFSTAKYGESAYHDEKVASEILSVSANEQILEFENEFDAIYKKQEKNLQEMGELTENFRKLEILVEEIGICEKDVEIVPDKTKTIEYRSFHDFEKRRLKLLKNMKNKSNDGFKATLTIKELEMDGEWDDNLFVVFKIQKRIRKTDLGVSAKSSVKNIKKFNSSKLMFKFSKRVLSDESLMVLLKSYDDHMSKDEGSKSVRLKKNLVHGDKKSSFKSYHLKSGDRNVGKLKLKITIESN